MSLHPAASWFVDTAPAPQSPAPRPRQWRSRPSRRKSHSDAMDALAAQLIAAAQSRTSRWQTRTPQSPRQCAPMPGTYAHSPDGRAPGWDWHSPPRSLRRRSALFHSLFDQHSRASKILHQFWWHHMPFLQIFRAVIRDRDFPIAALGDQYLQGQIDGKGWSRHHQWSSGLWAAEDDHLRRVHLQSDLLRLATVIDNTKNLQPSAGEG